MLESQKETFKEAGVRLVGINIDEPDRMKVVKGFAAQQGFTFLIVMNKTEEETFDVDVAFNVMGTPTSYLVDAKGSIADAHYGPLTVPELQASLEKVKAE